LHVWQSYRGRVRTTGLVPAGNAARYVSNSPSPASVANSSPFASSSNWAWTALANGRKSVAGAVKAIYHATGRYPDWWDGRQYERPTEGRIFAENYKKGAAIVIKKLKQWLPRDAKRIKDSFERLVYGGRGASPGCP
jgi:hypothetical protein